MKLEYDFKRKSDSFHQWLSETIKNNDYYIADALIVNREKLDVKS